MPSAEYLREYRKTRKGKAIMNNWNHSPAGKLSRKIHKIKLSAKRRPKETDAQYQARFTKCLQRIETTIAKHAAP